jgi:hypothetical protein
MSQLAKRISAMLQASHVFRTVVETLPFQADGSEPARQRLKEIEESLHTIKRERKLIRSEPLPATYPTTDRKGWEYDIRAYIPKLDKKCRETLRIAMEGQFAMEGQLAQEGQKKIVLEPSDSKHWSNIQLEMRDRCRDIDELGKRLSDLRAAIDEAGLVECDLLRLLSDTLQEGEGFFKARDFVGILRKHDAHYQQRFLIDEFVKKRYLQPAQLSDGAREETWMIVADTVKAALAKLTGDLSAYFAELRAFEDECYAATEGRSVIGRSCWSDGRGLTKLREIDARHGVQRDDPRVYSIAAYRREREAIRGELDNLRLQAAANTDDESLQALWWRCEVRLTDRSARHFPGLNLLDEESVDSTAKLWAYIVRGVEQSELAERVAGPSVHQKTLREVYKSMHRLGLTWGPRPPYGSLPDEQVVEELWHIANRLEQEERTEAAPAANVGPLLTAPTGIPAGAMPDPMPAKTPLAEAGGTQFDLRGFVKQDIEDQTKADERAAKERTDLDRMEPLVNALYAFHAAIPWRHESKIPRLYIFPPEQLESYVSEFIKLGPALKGYWGDQLADMLTADPEHKTKLFACAFFRLGIAGEEAELRLALEGLFKLSVINCTFRESLSYPSSQAPKFRRSLLAGTKPCASQ